MNLIKSLFTGAVLMAAAAVSLAEQSDAAAAWARHLSLFHRNRAPE